MWDVGVNFGDRSVQNLKQQLKILVHSKGYKGGV